MKTIKFYITPVYPYSNDHYYHEIIGLAEGLEALGFRIIGNANYWFIPEENRFLINEDVEGDFDIAVYDHRYVKSFDHLLFRKGFPNFDRSKKHILIDRFEDWLDPKWDKNSDYEIFDIIFACNLLKDFKIPKNVKPWAMGLTNRIINCIDKNNADINKEVIGINSRVNHNIRKLTYEGLCNVNLKYPPTHLYTGGLDQKTINSTEVDMFYFKATSKRHNPQYYKLLNEALLISTNGGYFELKPASFYPFSLLDRIKKIPYKWSYKLKKDFYSNHFIFQWDSFRLWECFYANTCPINLNFQLSNFLLPVMPEEGVHYIGLNKLDFSKFENKINSMTVDEIKSIGLKGKEWSLKHYSPKSQAERFIKEII